MLNDSGFNNVISFVPSFDYYLNRNKIRPYIGIGVGYYFLSTTKEVFVVNNPFDAVEVSINNQIGLLLRGGFDFNKLTIGKHDLSKFLLGLEFNFIPTATVKIPNGQLIGTINNTNIALSIGYRIGVGKKAS